MSIKELIEKLRHFDQDLEIVIRNVDGFGDEFLPVDPPEYDKDEDKVVI